VLAISVFKLSLHQYFKNLSYKDVAMKKIMYSAIGLSILLSASIQVHAKSDVAPPDYESRMDFIEQQVDGKLVGLNIVEYGGGKLYLPVIKTDSEMCVSVINTMHAKVTEPKKESDYEYQLALHCDEFAEEPIEFKGEPVKDKDGKPRTRFTSKGFEQAYLIELENGVAMHSVKYKSGTLKVWPKDMYDDWMKQNDKDVSVYKERTERTNARRKEVLKKLNQK